VTQALHSEPTPARPGPGPLPEALLRALDVSIGRRMEGLLAGDYRSTLLGDGTELAQVRPYVAGDDDVRRIDWNVTARTGVPHVRVHLAERVLVTWLVLDTSASMQFGTADRRKADVAEGVAIAVGHVATRRGNRLGLSTFGDATPRTLPPRQGRFGLLGLLSALRDSAAPSDAGKTPRLETRPSAANSFTIVTSICLTLARGCRSSIRHQPWRVDDVQENNDGQHRPGTLTKGAHDPGALIVVHEADADEPELDEPPADRKDLP